MAAKTINTRIQLKNDTEANWKKSVLPADNSQGTKVSGTSFVPLLGELIIFSADDAHPFSRLKVGNGTDDVLTLPFIDAGTVGGQLFSQIVLQYDSINSFPSIGQEDKMYIDLAAKAIYCYKANTGYARLSHFTYTATTTNIPIISNWDKGIMTTASIDGNFLTIENGREPELTFVDGGLNVVTSISEVNNNG